MNESTKQHFILLGLSFSIHVLIVVVLIFVARDNTLHKTFIVLGAHSQKPTRALYKPMHGAVPFVGNQSTATVSKSRKKNRKQATNKQTKKSVTKKEAAPTNEKALPEISSRSKKKSKKMVAAAKKQIPIASKKNRKSIMKQEELLKTIKPAEKKTNPPVEPAKETLQQPKEEPNSSNEIISSSDSEEEETLEFTAENPEYFDPRLYEYHVAIQQEISRTWQPPVGVEKGTEAIGCFTVNSNGEVTSFEFLNKSNIIIYDLSIKLAAKKCSFDKKLWGKKFVIAFRQ